jgi:CRISPR/Cas system-associated exonuclease Cas4 (RecB family)
MKAAVDTEPGAFLKVSDHPATIEALVRVSVELDNVDDHALDRLVARDAVASEAVRLHRAVIDRLGTGWFREVDLLLAAESAISGLENVVIFLPHDVRGPERQLLSRLLSMSSSTVIVGLTGTTRADRAVRELIGEPAKLEADDQDDSIVADHVFHASDADDEVRNVVRSVVESLREVPAHRIAVLYSAVNPYSRLVYEHLTQAGVRMNGRGMRSVVERAIPDSLLRLLDLAKNGIDRVPLFDALSRATMRYASVEVPVARWDRLAREAGVVAAADWEPRLLAFSATRNADAAKARAVGDEPRATWAAEAGTSAESLLAFINRLRGQLEAGQALHTWPELSRWALELFTEYVGDPDTATKLPAEERYAAAALRESLRGASVLGALLPEANLGAFIDCVRSELDATVPRVGRFGEGVFVGPVAEAAGLDLDVAFVVGLSDDLYPGRVGVDPLLPDRMRAEFPALRDERARVDGLLRSLAAVVTGSGRVTLSFPRGDLRRGSSRLPSRWVLPTLRVRGDAPGLVATRWETVGGDFVSGSESNWASVTGTSVPATAQEWRLRSEAAAVWGSDAIVDAARKMVSGRASDLLTRFDGVLSDAGGLPDYRSGVAAVAPTTLEGYAVCPHAFFVQRVLGVSPVEEPDEIVRIRAVDTGNLVHEALDRLVRENADELPGFGAPWPAKLRERFVAIAEEIGEGLEAAGLTGHRLMWERERQLIARDLLRMLDDDNQFRADRDARVVATEFAFDDLSVQVADGSVLMKGKVDLIEEGSDGRLYVIDVKTGRADRFAGIATDPIVAGTKLQLPVYALAAERDYNAAEIESMYWFVRSELKRVRVVLDDELRDRYGAAVGVLADGIAAGVFPQKPPANPDFGGRVECPFCNPDGLGHGEARSRYERKRFSPVFNAVRSLVDAAAVGATDD